jgi:hypothetical protein
MKALIASSIIALTATVANADQETYDKAMAEFYNAMFCVGMGDVLEDDYLEDMIEVLGEDIAIEVMDVRSASFSEFMNVLTQSMQNPKMNKIWTKRFSNNALGSQSEFQSEGWEHTQNSFEALGISSTVSMFLEKCK